MIQGRARTALVAGRAPAPTARKLRFGKRGMFLMLVALPTALTALYLFLIASNQFISETRFVVRSAQKQGMSGLGAILQGSGLGGGRDDSFSVIDFIKSRDALREVDEKIGFREMVSRSSADFLARFPAFYAGDSFEELYEHYQGIVNVVHDPSTGIDTLKVRSFEAGDSRRLAEALLQASERLVNRMNERALGDAVALAAREIKTAEQRSAAAQKALTTYRIAVGLVDMGSTARTYVELVSGMSRELAATRAQLSQMVAASPGNPGIQSLRDRATALEQQIAIERSKLLGNDGSLVGTFAEFERLTLEAEFAAKALTATNAMLETARIDAMRKQLYLERVVEPNLADLSRYPRRFLATFTVFGTTFLAYSILWLVIVNAREHAS
ncbi:capsule biosynthesis protein [uncultured Enterovirga sp.]|uniref:capsule biosynthesis protein n=1 Tax=uncultured Enterovirga sp. TaxID=2026352 RepID=UPI0035C98B24